MRLTRLAFYFLVGLLLGANSVVAFAGYAFSGVCYQDTASALNAFRDAVPQANPAGITTFTTQPTISGSGLITWSISHRPLTGTAATTRTGSTQLPTCTTETLSQWSLQSLLYYVALVFSAFVGFRTGFRP